MAIIPRTSSVSSAPLFSGNAVSSTARSRNGEIMARPDEKMISAMTAPNRKR